MNTIYAEIVFQAKHGTREQWQSANPVLLAGEHGVVTDGTAAEKEKIGDGVTPWNELEWWKSGEGLSAYEIAVKNGFVGSEAQWLFSLRCDGGIGKGVDGFGEIFNDYENNVATIKGYRIKNISVASDKQYAVITLNDASLDDKAVDRYSKDDIVNLDIGNYYCLMFKISDSGVGGDGNSVLTVVKTDGGLITENMSLNADNNWLYVVDKSYGEVVTQTFYAHTEGANNKAVGLGAHSEGKDNQSVGIASHTEGRKNTAGYASHAEGRETVAQAPYSHTEGLNTKATGQISHAEGQSAQAKGDISHAEGFCTKADGVHSHAEGENTKAQGQGAHAEGGYGVAEGKYAHSEGYNTKAQGNFSHAGGENCIASASAQTAIGRNNKVNDNALFVVGNGTTNVLRSNAFEVLSDGSITVGGVTLTPTKLQRLLDLL